MNSPSFSPDSVTSRDSVTSQELQSKSQSIPQKVKEGIEKTFRSVKSFFSHVFQSNKQEIRLINRHLEPTADQEVKKTQLKEFSQKIKSFFKTNLPRWINVHILKKDALDQVISQSNKPTSSPAFHEKFKELKQSLATIATQEKPQNYKLRLDKQGNFKVEAREKSPFAKKDHISKDESSTIIKALTIIGTGIKNHWFDSTELEDLNFIKKQLETQFEDILTIPDHEITLAFQKLWEVSEQVSYIEQTSSHLQGKPLTASVFYEQLFSGPEQANLRQDFLLAAPWMSFVKNDPDRDLMMTHLQNIYHKSPETKKIQIIQFLAVMVEKNLLKMDKAQNFVRLNSLQENSVEVRSELQKLQNTGSSVLIKTAEIRYEVDQNTVNVSQEFDKIAKDSHPNPEEFINKFAQDLSIISQNNHKNIDPSEFIPKANTDQKTYAIQFFNKISNFVREQIIMKDHSKEERANLYGAFYQLAVTLANDYHDYSAGMAIFAGLNHFAVINTVEKENQTLRNGKIFNTLNKKTQRYMEEANTIFSSEKNSANLRSAYSNHSYLGEKYNPSLATFESDFTFANDGNPQTTDANNPKFAENSINLYRLKMLASIHNKIINFQSQLTTENQLNFNTLSEILNLSDNDINNDRLLAKRQSEIRNAS